jgi:cyclophilin family peptidyl-prolyl cis-trans isomerase
MCPGTLLPSHSGRCTSPEAHGQGYRLHSHCTLHRRPTVRRLWKLAFHLDGTEYLDGKHAVFGHFVEGLDTLDKINEV